MSRSDDELLRSANASVQRVIDQLSRDRAELAKAGQPEGERHVANALQSAVRVSEVLKSSTNPDPS